MKLLVPTLTVKSCFSKVWFDGSKLRVMLLVGILSVRLGLMVTLALKLDELAAWAELVIRTERSIRTERKTAEAIYIYIYI